MPRAKQLPSEMHHCSQCNRPNLHTVFKHKDGVRMTCPCGHSFVDVRATASVKVSEENGSHES